MSSNLIAVALMFAALAAVACFASPGDSSPCCQDRDHNNPVYGEVGYCPTRGY